MNACTFYLTALVLICASAPTVSARRSPHADFVEEYFTTGPGAGLYSDNLLEDAKLDVPDLIRKYGYPCEVHEVTTEDGYILEMQRIPHGRDQNNVYNTNKPVVLVMHGLLASAADWVIAGPGSGLGYILAEAGYDVWLGNARGTTYSRKHTKYNPDVHKRDFWVFSWEEIGRLDLPAKIDYILEKTGKPRIHYIGHSQGTTAFWVMASLRPEYNDKIITMQAFAPVAFLEYNENPLFKFLAPYASQIETIGGLIGFYELLPRNDLIAWFGKTGCADGVATQVLCENFLFLVAGRSEDMLNSTLLPLKLAHIPAGSSARQIVHFGQHIGQSFFRRFDHGTFQNLIKYGSTNAPDYDLSKITASIYMHYVEHDVFAHIDDLEKLTQRLKSIFGMFKVEHDTFSHLDFMWGIGAKTLLYDKAINLMNVAGNE